jgi:hypothetical protein
MSPSHSTPTGRLSKASLRRVWIAAALHSVSESRFKKFTRTYFGAPTTYKQAWTAAGSLKEASPWRGAAGRPRGEDTESPPARPEPSLRAWLVVDEPALGLTRVLYRLGNDGLPRPDLVNALGELAGVRQVIEVGSDRELLIIGIVEDIAEARDLRARIEDHAVGQPVRMDLIEHEDHTPARATWIGLASRQIERDQERGS